MKRKVDSAVLEQERIALGTKYPIIGDLQREEELVWINPNKTDAVSAGKKIQLTMEDITDAEERLQRFAPFIMHCFPETIERGGIIESVLTEVPTLKKRLNETYHAELSGRLFLKRDSDLAIAGSVKARGGIYEVLKHTEDLAFQHGILSGVEDDYTKLAFPEAREIFRNYTVQVGSTGNLGLSIGIMSAAVGFQVIVHMSADAKQWKKDMLRSHGVTVMEYESDYSEAVERGRESSDANPQSYFVDDENSKNLFMGYAVAAKRIVSQLAEQNVTVDAEHPLFLYVPCGVGGAPGGLAFGMNKVFGDHVHTFFIEPTQAPCMLLGMATGLQNQICVQDIGLTGLTHADGLAVGRASGFVGRIMEPILSGEFTLQDHRIYDYMRDLLETEDIFVEPSACAAMQAAVMLNQAEQSRNYLNEHGLTEKMPNAAHILWATGGKLVPEEMRQEYIHTHLK